MAVKDYYADLGVGRNATTTEISRAYRRAAAPSYSDIQTKSKESLKADFIKALEAYRVLENEETRKAYDATLPPVAPPTPPQDGFDFLQFISEALHSLVFIPLVLFC